MKDRELKKYLRQSLQRETEPEKRRTETIKLCMEMMREQKSAQEEPRTDFIRYLSDMLRFEGIPIFGLQAVALVIICFMIFSATGLPKYMPVFMPLFVLAVMPAMFKGRYYGMSEIEAVTRASGSQVILAKLVLAGAANLVCMTVLITFVIYLQNSYREIGQIILYCLVPYFICMVSMLRLIRLRRKESIQICTIIIFSSCVCWSVSAKTMPWLYEASAFGLWIFAFLFFTAFFIKEIYFILIMRKEGKIYGVIA